MDKQQDPTVYSMSIITYNGKQHEYTQDFAVYFIIFSLN